MSALLALATEAPAFGPRGETIFSRTYYRTKPDGTLENWADASQRVAMGNLALVYGPPETWSEEVWDEARRLFLLIYRMRGLPAGRHLYATGVKGRQYLFNCFVSPWGELQSRQHGFQMARLFEGGGVGANYSNRYLEAYVPKRELKVHVVCSPDHPDYAKMLDAGLLSTQYSPDWPGAFPVQDTREGWVEAQGDLLDTYYLDEVKHADRVYDVSRVRPEGSPLRTMGGTASGPLPLVRLLHTIGEVMNKRAAVGGHVSSLDAMRIDHATGVAVVAGGVRRSARMSMKSWRDSDIFDFIGAKADSGEHWTTNISIEIDNEFIAALNDELSGDPQITEHAYDVYRAAVAGMLQNGEPGFWNRDLSQVGEVNEIVATNPCLPADAWVMTTDGPARIADLIGRPFTALVDGKPYQTESAGFFRTGYKPVLRLALQDGQEVRLTSDHKVLTHDGEWVEAGDLKPGDLVRLHDHFGADWAGRGTADEGYLLGHLVGDGTFTPEGRALLAVWDTDPGAGELRDYLWAQVQALGVRSDNKGWKRVADTDQWRLAGRGLTALAGSYGIRRGSKTVTEAVERASSAFYVGFLRGLFDTDGHIEGKSTEGGVSIRLTSVDMPALQSVQRMLGRLGIRSAIRSMKEAKQSFGQYESQTCYRLVIAGGQAERFMATVGFLNPEKIQKWSDRTSDMARGFYAKPFASKVASVTEDGMEDVYDVTVADVHAFDANGIYVHNCGEIPLPGGGACVLGHVNLQAFAPKTREEKLDVVGLREAHRLMTRFLIRATYGDMNDEQQAQVMQTERRIGVGHFGMQGMLAKMGIRYSQAPADPAVRGLFRMLRQTVRDEARAYAFQLRIPEPVKVTTEAPTGTIAKGPGTSEGCQAIYARTFIGRTRFSMIRDSEFQQVSELMARGHHAEPDRMDSTGNTWVVEFPTKDPLVAEVEAMGYPAEIVESQDEISLADSLAFQAMIQAEYADNAVSYTVNVPAEPHQQEAMSVGAWSTPAPTPERVQEVMDTLLPYLPRLKGTTLMVDGSRPQAPYERMSAEDYEAAVTKSVEVGYDENCASGACPVR